MADLNAAIAEQVRRELAARKLTATDLAPVLGVGVQTAQRRVAGSRDFEINDIPILSAFFDVDLLELVTGVAA